MLGVPPKSRCTKPHSGSGFRLYFVPPLSLTQQRCGAVLPTKMFTQKISYLQTQFMKNTLLTLIIVNI